MASNKVNESPRRSGRRFHLNIYIIYIIYYYMYYTGDKLPALITTYVPYHTEASWNYRHRRGYRSS